MNLKTEKNCIQVPLVESPIIISLYSGKWSLHQYQQTK